jgi:aspartate kinase
MDLLQKNVAGELGASNVVGDPRICKVSIVGIGMRSHAGRGQQNV